MRISDWSSDVCSSDLQLMALAESEDRKNVPDGMEVPQEIALRQARLAVLDEAKRTLEARATERDLAAQAEYESKLAMRQAKRDSGNKPKGKDPQPPTCAPQKRSEHSRNPLPQAQ